MLTAAYSLDKLLSAAEVQKSGQKKNDASDRQEKTAFKDRTLPDEGVHLTRQREWIEKNVPERTADQVDGIHKDKEQQSQHNHDHGRSVPATRQGGEEKCEVTEKQHGE